MSAPGSASQDVRVDGGEDDEVKEVNDGGAPSLTAGGLVNPVVNALIAAMQVELGNLRTGMGHELASLEGRQNARLDAAMEQVRLGFGAADQSVGDAARAANAANQEALRAQQVAIEAGNLAARINVPPVGPPSSNQTQMPLIAPIKPPQPPRFKGVNKQPGILEWTYCAQSYLRAAGLENHEQGIWHIANFLEDDALAWWRLYSEGMDNGTRPRITTWAEMKRVMVDTFQIFNHETNLRDRYEALKQTGSVNEYIAAFRTIVIELEDEPQKARIYRFLKGLKPAIQAATRTHKPTTLEQAMDIADEADRSQLHAYGGRIDTTKEEKNGVSTDLDGFTWPAPAPGPVPMEVNAVRLSAAERSRLMSEGRCFNCKQTGHMANECPSLGKKKRGG